MIVALTALGSMTVPNEEFAAAFRLVKYGFLILGGYLGIYGACIRSISAGESSGRTDEFRGSVFGAFYKERTGGQWRRGNLENSFAKKKLKTTFAREEQKIRLKRRESGS